MSMFDLPVKARLPKIIGVLDHQLYVLVTTGNAVDIWSMNVYIPDSWQKQWHFEFAEIAYITATVMKNNSCIYFLFTGCYVSLHSMHSLHLTFYKYEEFRQEKTFTV
jgi:hypothetical protein